MRATLVLVLLLIMPAARASAQLISPGKLTTSHAGLEGVRGCTNCHELRKPGASSARCLDCHATLARRMSAGRGYHAQLARQECGECHKEHFGREFALVRLDSTSFEHSRTGYRLEGEHAQVACGECHQTTRIEAADVRQWTQEHSSAAKTFLGLPTACASCHAADDPHQGQFGRRRCDDCHGAAQWTSPPRFDHARSDYPLTGKHREASCAGCHATERAAGAAFVRYDGVKHDGCASCHRDEHGGAMGATCATCHDANGWARVDRRTVANGFDHTRTRFALAGRHAAAACSDCHDAAHANSGIRLRFAGATRNATFPRPQFESCTSCHVDAHEGAFVAAQGGSACNSCHTEDGWQPVLFDIERHARVARFPLTGAHVATPCTRCHTTTGATAGAAAKAKFRIEAECAACHGADSPHGEVFGARSCAECHETTSFRVAAFDHAKVASASCRSCHDRQNPHADQFGETDCRSCHDTNSYRIEQFDHTRTRFALDGAHTRAACSACHSATTLAGRTLVRYRPLPTTCVACHGGAR